MATNASKTKKRVTHINNASESNAHLDSGSYDFIHDILKNMDSTMNNFNESKNVENILKNFQNKNEVFPTPSSDERTRNIHGSIRVKKFLAPNKHFPLMAKCQKNLKFLQHNRSIPKQRAHVSALPKSPRKKYHFSNKSPIKNFIIPKIVPKSNKNEILSHLTKHEQTLRIKKYISKFNESFERGPEFMNCKISQHKNFQVKKGLEQNSNELKKTVLESERNKRKKGKNHSSSVESLKENNHLKLKPNNINNSNHKVNSEDSSSDFENFLKKHTFSRSKRTKRSLLISTSDSDSESSGHVKLKRIKKRKKIRSKESARKSDKLEINVPLHYEQENESQNDLSDRISDGFDSDQSSDTSPEKEFHSSPSPVTKMEVDKYSKKQTEISEKRKADCSKSLVQCFVLLKKDFTLDNLAKSLPASECKNVSCDTQKYDKQIEMPNAKSKNSSQKLCSDDCDNASINKRESNNPGVLDLNVEVAPISVVDAFNKPDVIEISDDEGAEISQNALSEIDELKITGSDQSIEHKTDSLNPMHEINNPNLIKTGIFSKSLNLNLVNVNDCSADCDKNDSDVEFIDVVCNTPLEKTLLVVKQYDSAVHEDSKIVHSHIENSTEITSSSTHIENTCISPEEHVMSDSSNDIVILESFKKEKSTILSQNNQYLKTNLKFFAGDQSKIKNSDTNFYEAHKNSEMNGNVLSESIEDGLISSLPMPTKLKLDHHADETHIEQQRCAQEIYSSKSAGTGRQSQSDLHVLLNAQEICVDADNVILKFDAKNSNLKEKLMKLLSNENCQLKISPVESKEKSTNDLNIVDPLNETGSKCRNVSVKDNFVSDSVSADVKDSHDQNNLCKFKLPSEKNVDSLNSDINGNFYGKYSAHETASSVSSKSLYKKCSSEALPVSSMYEKCSSEALHKNSFKAESLDSQPSENVTEISEPDDCIILEDILPNSTKGKNIICVDLEDNLETNFNGKDCANNVILSQDYALTDEHSSPNVFLNRDNSRETEPKVDAGDAKSNSSKLKEINNKNLCTADKSFQSVDKISNLQNITSSQTVNGFLQPQVTFSLKSLNMNSTDMKNEVNDEDLSLNILHIPAKLDSSSISKVKEENIYSDTRGVDDQICVDFIDDGVVLKEKLPPVRSEDGSSLIPKVNIDEVFKAPDGSIMPLLKLYKKEHKYYQELKETGRNVDVGLKSMIQFQVEKLKHLSLAIQNIAKCDPCFLQVWNACQIQDNELVEKTDDDSEKVISSLPIKEESYEDTIVKPKNLLNLPASCSDNSTLPTCCSKDCNMKNCIHSSIQSSNTSSSTDCFKNTKKELSNNNVMDNKESSGTIQPNYNLKSQVSSHYLQSYAKSYEPVQVFEILKKKKCAVCNRPAVGACSQCCQVYYCSEECLESPRGKEHSENCVK